MNKTTKSITRVNDIDFSRGRGLVIAVNHYPWKVLRAQIEICHEPRYNTVGFTFLIILLQSSYRLYRVFFQNSFTRGTI